MRPCPGARTRQATHPNRQQCGTTRDTEQIREGNTRELRDRTRKAATVGTQGGPGRDHITTNIRPGRSSNSASLLPMLSGQLRGSEFASDGHGRRHVRRTKIVPFCKRQKYSSDQANSHPPNPFKTNRFCYEFSSRFWDLGILPHIKSQFRRFETERPSVITRVIIHKHS